MQTNRVSGQNIESKFIVSQLNELHDSKEVKDKTVEQIDIPKKPIDEFTLKQDELKSILKKNSLANENLDSVVIDKKNLRGDPFKVIEKPREAVIQEPTVLSLGRPATADVLGNLAPPDVVTNEDVADWLKDRWQAAKDLTGAPIPGEHWLEIDLQRVCTITKVLIDWEKAYSDSYTVVGRAYIKKPNDLGAMALQEVWVVLATSKQARLLAMDKMHVIHEVMVNNEVTVYQHPERRMSIPPIRFVRLIIHKPAHQQWGSSVWRFVVHGFELSRF